MCIFRLSRRFIAAITLILGFFPLGASADPNCSDVADKTSFYDFRTACFKHDVCYSEAGLLGLKRSDCDQRFYQEMRASCVGRSVVCSITARVFYVAVHQGAADSFKNASRKSAAIKKLIQENRDSQMRQLLRARRSGQDAWVTRTSACFRESSDKKKKACLEERNEVQVPDYPYEYHLAGCNILGIGWEKGHRARNIQIMARRTGLSENQIEASRGGDPCEGYYPATRSQ